MGIDIKDAPLFLPDGQTILFSAPTPGQAYQPTGLRHGIRVVKRTASFRNGGLCRSLAAPTQLTQIGATNLYADVSPDNQYIASSSGEGNS
jgi:hypothetical protein